ncbi:hypothetical protein NHX12_013983 [Muraenolepis orangiensis]|uniref:Uncharacterized protein n=1 Tax=Muraenolepis orangiensis TaxID=630683 RepID=A0A9Q0DBN1_9TELE|nr:hypothetical protein NHX12_013983 [Muraenolepis orangiensis]
MGLAGVSRGSRPSALLWTRAAPQNGSPSGIHHRRVIGRYGPGSPEVQTLIASSGGPTREDMLSPALGFILTL